jgi:hypothetical protein
MLKALESAESKLREYYAMTDDRDLGDIYAHGTILALELKTQFFLTPEWSDTDYSTQYIGSLRDRMEAYQIDSHLATQPTFMASTQRSELDKALGFGGPPTRKRDEIEEYLKGGMKYCFHPNSAFILTLLSSSLCFYPYFTNII